MQIRRVVAVLVLVPLGIFPTLISARDLGSLTILGENYPRVFYFRASESASNLKAYPTYESWERDFSGLMGIMGKCLQEECTGREPRNPEFFSRFKGQHPDQVVLLHFNGNARDPVYHCRGYFPGHWVYRRAVAIVEDIPATSGETTIKVADAGDFRVNTGRYRTSNDDIALFGIRDGKHDWYHCEQVQLTAVDYGTNTLTVRRGCYGTRPLAFKAGEARAAAHAVEGPWGQNNHLLWFYNYSTDCPRDSGGRTCTDVLVDDLAAWFGEEGILKAFDGLEFDVLFNGTNGDTDGDGTVDNGIIDGQNRYGIGVVEFGRKLRAGMGENFIIQADGALGKGGSRSQRNWGIFNGIESEGWPNLNDWEIDDWSGGLNRHFFWQQNARQPVFNYINHKWIQPVPDRPGHQNQADVPFSRHRLVFAAAQFFDAMLCYSSVPNPPYRRLPGGEGFPVWDEFVCGEDHVLGWLGRPEAPAVHLPVRQPDLLSGRGHGADLAAGITGDVSVSLNGDGVRIISRDAVAGEVMFSMNDIPAAGADLFVSVTMKGEPMTGCPREMARFATLSVSGGVTDLMVGKMADQGMCLRGGREETVDRLSGAQIQQGNRTVNGVGRKTVFVHPPWRNGTGYTFWSKDAHVPADAELRFYIGMGEKSPERSDGVWFKIDAAVFGPEDLGSFDRIFEASSKVHEWLPQAVSLDAYAGKRIRLKFISDAGPDDNSTTDHAHWGEVRIVKKGVDEGRLTESAEHMTWVNDRFFTSGFYFNHIKTDTVDLTFRIESVEPVTVESVTVHAHPDAMYRIFEKGLVLANPARVPYTFDLDTLTPGRTYRRIQGTKAQDKTANNGQPVKGPVTLGERDALFLLQTE